MKTIIPKMCPVYGHFGMESCMHHRAGKVLNGQKITDTLRKRTIDICPAIWPLGVMSKIMINNETPQNPTYQGHLFGSGVASKWEFIFHVSLPFCHTFASLFFPWPLGSTINSLGHGYLIFRYSGPALSLLEASGGWYKKTYIFFSDRVHFATIGRKA